MAGRIANIIVFTRRYFFWNAHSLPAWERTVLYTKLESDNGTGIVRACNLFYDCALESTPMPFGCRKTRNLPYAYILIMEPLVSANRRIFWPSDKIRARAMFFRRLGMREHMLCPRNFFSGLNEKEVDFSWVRKGCKVLRIRFKEEETKIYFVEETKNSFFFLSSNFILSARMYIFLLGEKK